MLDYDAVEVLLDKNERQAYVNLTHELQKAFGYEAKATTRPVIIAMRGEDAPMRRRVALIIATRLRAFTISRERIHELLISNGASLRNADFIEEQAILMRIDRSNADLIEGQAKQKPSSGFNVVLNSNTGFAQFIKLFIICVTRKSRFYFVSIDKDLSFWEKFLRLIKSKKIYQVDLSTGFVERVYKLADQLVK